MTIIIDVNLLFISAIVYNTGVLIALVSINECIVIGQSIFRNFSDVIVDWGSVNVFLKFISDGIIEGVVESISRNKVCLLNIVVRIEYVQKVSSISLVCRLSIIT
jgi:hypothetical protein